MGADDALVDTYDGNTNTIYVAKPSGSVIRKEVYDSDSSSGDDFMGSIELVLNSGQQFSSSYYITSNGDVAVSFYAECVQ